MAGEGGGGGLHTTNLAHRLLYLVCVGKERCSVHVSAFQADKQQMGKELILTSVWSRKLGCACERRL